MEQLATFFRETSTLTELNREITSINFTRNVYGYFDLLTSGLVNKATKIVEESTHIFITEDICDIQKDDKVIINGDRKRVYKVNFVDNPLMLNEQLEIELEFLPNEEIPQDVEV